jgi:hypothetical protein
LDFAGSGVVDSRITFTRASAATATNALGVLQTLRNDRPRIDYNGSTGECKGLLIEEQRTNLFTYSEQFDDASWVKSSCTVTPNQIISPDGTLSGERAVFTSGGLLYKNLIPNAAGTYTITAWVKSATGATQNMRIFGNGATSYSSNISVTTEWQRVSFTFTYSSATSGFGTASGSALDIYIWGAQLEVGAFPTSYVATTPTFTSRASSATYYDSTGVLRIAGTNQARTGFGYDTTTAKWVSQGLILEAAATNLLTNSEDFSTWTAADGATVTTNQGVAPDGNTTADRYAADTTSHLVRTSIAGIAANTTYTFSVWIKGVSASGTVALNISQPQPTPENTKTISYTTEWKRYELTGSSTSSTFYVQIGQWATNGLGPSSDILIWGAQLETGFVATSYIRTVGAAATRAADVSSSAATTRAYDLAEITGANFSPWWNQTQGTYYIENSYGGFSNQPIVLSDYNGNAWSYATTTGVISVYLVAPPSVALASSVTAAVNTNYRAAFSYGSAGKAITASNTTPVISTNTLLSNSANLWIGSFGAGYFINGCIKKIAYYPIQVTSTQLQALTV